jgi:protein-S-isoprenylcysteine O-methyltransferase Ste14
MTIPPPPLVAAGCVTAYWATVAVKSIRIARLIRRDPNVIPREKTGRLMRLIWAPTILAWNILPWLNPHPGTPGGVLRSAVGAAGAVVCLLALGGSYHCWHEMGASWRIGIDPNEKTALIVSGAYRHLRHPIYSLSIFLMLGTLAAVPTPAMLVVAAVHCTLMQIEARREESHMLRVHGETYRAYMQTTGRFLPKF